MIEIIRLDNLTPKSYFEEIAQLHIETIHHGALPLLGKGFMTSLYYELSTTLNSGVWCAGEDKQVLGFVSGCADLRRTYMDVFLKAGIVLMGLGFRACLNLRIIKKVLALFSYPFHKTKPTETSVNIPMTNQKAQLLAISVNASVQRGGIGKQLIQVLEKSMLDWNIHTYYVTTNITEVSSNSFYRKYGFIPYGTIRHHDLILQIYQKNICET